MRADHRVPVNENVVLSGLYLAPALPTIPCASEGKTAKLTSISSPGSEAARDHIADHRADIFFLRGIIVGPCIVSRHSECPTALALFEVLQKPRGVRNIEGGIEHIAQRRKILTMPAVIDLHASDVDEADAMRLLNGHAIECFLQSLRMQATRAHIYVVWAKDAVTSSFCEPHRKQHV